MSSYDDVAEWYDARMREDSLLHGLALPTLRDLIGGVANQDICDLGCGQE